MYNKLKLVVSFVIVLSMSSVNAYSNEYNLNNDTNTVFVPVEDEKFLQQNDYLISHVDMLETKSILLEQLKNTGLLPSTNITVEHFCNLSFRLSNEFSLLLFINEPYMYFR